MPRSTEIEVTLLMADIFDRLGVAYLLGGSVASSLMGMPSLDHAYLDRWAPSLGVADLLAKALREATATG